MKKLFRIHFAAIAVSDLLLLAIFISKTDPSVDWLLLSGFIFILAQGLLLFRLVNRLKKHFSEIYPQINKKFRFYYLGVLISDFLLFVLLAFTSSQRFSIICLFSHHWPSIFLLSYSNLYFLSFYFILYNG